MCLYLFHASTGSMLLIYGNTAGPGLANFPLFLIFYLSLVVLSQRHKSKKHLVCSQYAVQCAKR